MSLLEVLKKETHSEVAQYVRELCGFKDQLVTDRHPNRIRRAKIAQRLRLYRNVAEEDFRTVINNVYTKPKIQRQRADLIPLAKFENVTKRITAEVASLYDRPAKYKFGNDDETAVYNDAVKASRWPAMSRMAHHMMFLCGHVLMWQIRTDEKTTEFRLVTPDRFSVIPHPDDDLRLAGILLDQKPEPAAALVAGNTVITHELWDDTYRYKLRADGNVAEVQEHGLGRIPGVLLHAEEPVESLLELYDCDDIVSAHLSLFLYNLMIVRLSKSQGERQPVISGDGANLAVGQDADGEEPITLPTNVTAFMLDMKTDPDHYLTAKRDVKTSVAQTYGMSYDVLNYTDDMSGRAYNARRAPLREIRERQKLRAHENEKAICKLLGFDPAFLSVDFSEQTIPLDAAEEVDLLDAKMRLGIDSPIEYLMRKDTDLTRDDAEALLALNIGDRAQMVTMMRALNAPTDPGDAGGTPDENGQLGGTKQDASGSATPQDAVPSA